MNLTPIERVPVVMTPTMKKYLLFLSARVYKPTTAKRPGYRSLKLMVGAGWIQTGHYSNCILGAYQRLYITPYGEEALNIEADKEGVERGRVTWCNIASMPEHKRLLITDGTVVTTGIREGVKMFGAVNTPVLMWSHWAAFPSPPIVAWDFGQQKGRME